MASAQHHGFTTDNVSVDIYNPAGPMVQRFNVRYFWLSIVNAQLKEAVLRESALYENFSRYVTKDDIKKYLEDQKAPYDEGDYGVGIRKDTIEVGHGIASVKSSTGPDTYKTTFPFMSDGDPSYQMLKRAYYCNCDAGKWKPRAVDLLLCEHEAKAVIKSHVEYKSLDFGFASPGMIKITGDLVKRANRDSVASRSEIYEKYNAKKNESGKIIRDEFSRIVNRKFI